jgi:hypothetical protein
VGPHTSRAQLVHQPQCLVDCVVKVRFLPSKLNAVVESEVVFKPEFVHEREQP